MVLLFSAMIHPQNTVTIKACSFNFEPILFSFLEKSMNSFFFCKLLNCHNLIVQFTRIEKDLRDTTDSFHGLLAANPVA